MKARSWFSSIVLLGALGGVAFGLAVWKMQSLRKAGIAAASQPEPMESVIVAVVQKKEHQRTTTSVGTVLALRSVTLRNELAGVVRQAALIPGQIVEEGTILVGQDVTVEQAELKAQEAQAALAETTLHRAQRLGENRVAAEAEVDRARAERDVARAQIARTRAVMERKTIRAPFRARVGMADLHPGQYLNEGTQLTTLQGVDEAVHVDFTVAQAVAAGLREGDVVEITATNEASGLTATIVALDARVDPATRNAMVRAKIQDAEKAPRPGSSVLVRVPVGTLQNAVAIPVSALRRGPEGDHVFVIAPDKSGHPRASMRHVESGVMLGDEVLIYKGLAEGERVAAAGSFKLRESALVAVVPSPEPDGTQGVAVKP